MYYFLFTVKIFKIIRTTQALIYLYLIKKGRLKVREQIYTGFEHMREAFIGLFRGDNIGKAIVKAVNTQTNYP
jgi:NADPH-dependent curcumin reductase CurA